MAKNEAPRTETETGDAPLIDLNDVAIKKLIARAKKRASSPTTSSTRRCRRTR